MFNLAEHIQPPQPRDIEIITGEILDAKRTGGEAILTIGRGLIEAKAVLPHGEWLPWLNERVEFSERTARNFMRLAKDWTNRQALADLGATKALQLLALPESERETFLGEPHLVGGEEKMVIDMTSRELETALKERDEARKAAAQAEAAQKAADEAREKLSAGMALANERIAGLNAEVEQYSARVKEARDAATQLERELAELRARPVEVAVQVDEAAVETARKEVEAAMQNKLDRATAARDKALKKRYELEESLTKAKAEADEARKAAEEAKAQAQEELDRVKADAEFVRARAEQAEKKAALVSNEDLVVFQMLLDQGQEVANKLGGVLMKLRNKDPETAGKVAQAMLALAEQIKGVAGQ